jgi:hypothetical protein
MQIDHHATAWGGRRPGAGRKPIPTDRRLKRRTVYLTDQEWEACMCNCAIGMTPAEYIRQIIHHAQQQRQHASPLSQDQSKEVEPANI